MSVQEQSLIGWPKITPIRMLLADDSDVSRPWAFRFSRGRTSYRNRRRSERVHRIAREGPRTETKNCINGLAYAGQIQIQTWFVRSELQASAEHVLAMSRSYDDAALVLSNSYGASLLLDKSKLITELVRTVEKLCA